MPTKNNWAWLRRAGIALPILLAILTMGYWAQGVTSLGAHNQDEVRKNQKAIVSIGEQVNIHITKARFQDCYQHCIPPAECPPEPQTLPSSRCQ